MENKLQTMSAFLTEDKMKSYLQKMLGERTNQFITTLSTIVGSNQSLNECDRASLMSCALKATSMNLPIDQSLGMAYIIPYKNKGMAQAQFQIGWKGLVQLAQRSGQIAGINAIEVREGEFRGRDFLGDPIIQWLTEEERTDKQIIGYMAGIRLVTGFTKTLYWTVAEIEKHASRYSQAYRYAKKFGQSDAVWIEKFDEMAKKTVLKQLISKYAPMSIELQQAIKYDQAVILTDTDNETEVVLYVDNESDTIETIDKKQQEEIAKIIAKDKEKLQIINDLGYEIIKDIPKSEYENIINTIS